MSNSDYHRNRTHPDDDQELEEFQQQNSFENGNQIFELRSQVNSLKIERQRLAIQHQRASAALEARNQQFQNENKILRKERTDLRNLNKNLQDQLDETQKIAHNLRNNLESITRKTAEFHKSSPDDLAHFGDPRDMIKQLLEKEDTITKLNNQLSHLKQNANNPSKHSIDQDEQQKLYNQTKTLKTQIQELKKKEIAYKREYENMLQAKQEIIKKMSIQGDDSLRRLNESKDKMVVEIRNQLEETLKKNQTLKTENKSLRQKMYVVEQQITQIKAQYRKKQENIFYNYELQKQDLTKDLSEKMKKHIQDKQTKLKKADNRVYQLQNQILLLKQQTGKQKAQITSLQQFNSYLETSNQEHEQSKKKFLDQLYKKDKEIGEFRQKYFEEISDLKKQMINQRGKFEQKIIILEEQLGEKRFIVTRYESDMTKKEKVASEGIKKEYQNFQKQVSRLVQQKSQLNKQLMVLSQNFKDKSDKLLSLQKDIRKQFEQKITNLEIQLLKQKRKSSDRGNDDYRQPTDLQVQLKKLKLVNQHHELDKEQKTKELNRLRQKNSILQRQLKKTEGKVIDNEKKFKDKKQDYESLQKQFDQLSQKYKHGIKQLQTQIQDMTHQISKLQRNGQRKKNKSEQVESNLTNQVKHYKLRIHDLQAELDDIKTNKIENSKITDMKIQKYAQELEVLKREKELAIKTQVKGTKQIEGLYDNEKKKLMQYIQQLEQSNQIIKNKLELVEKKGKRNNQGLEQQLKQLKIQYSESLTEINLLLQKYKKLQEIHIKTLTDIDAIKEDYDTLYGKYSDVLKEKNRILDNLNSSYDQVNKLNSVLMSKEEQLSRSKVVNCPHFNQENNIAQYDYASSQRYDRNDHRSNRNDRYDRNERNERNNHRNERNSHYHEHYNSKEKQKQLQREIDKDLYRANRHYLSPAGMKNTNRTSGSHIYRRQENSGYSSQYQR